MLNTLQCQKDFPALSGQIYLNTAAEGISPVSVGVALQQYFVDAQKGMAGRDEHFRQWRELRAIAGRFLGLSADEIALCSCSSEAYNLAAQALKLGVGDEVVINDLDFPSGVTPWMQPSSGVNIRLWRSRDGVLHFSDLIPLLNEKTCVVATSYVSFYNGFKIDFPAFSTLVRRLSKALITVDVTQALGRIEMDLSEADLIVSSTHKWILGSHGGCLVGVPKRLSDRWSVPAGGWHNLKNAFVSDRFEREAESLSGAAGFMVGMPNFPAIYAVNAALIYIESIGVSEIMKHADPLVQKCLAGLNDLSLNIISPNDVSSLAGIVAFLHPDADEICQALASESIHVMFQAGRIRIALHGYNTEADVDCFLSTLKTVLEKL